MATIGDDLKTLFDRNLRSNMKLLARAGGVLRAAGRAARDPQRLRGTDARALVSDLLQLQLDYYRNLSEQSVQYLSAVVSLAEGAVASAPTAPDTAASATVLSGRPGETLAFQFALDNPNDQPVNAAIESRDWLGRDGSAGGADTMSFEPAATGIEPRTTKTIVGRVHIDGRFDRGGTYDTQIRVAGFPGREVTLTLTVAGDPPG